MPPIYRERERELDFDFERELDFEREPDFLRLLEPDDREGTLPPSRRASDSPIAIACFRLLTFLPERPLRKVPSLRSCIARFTFCPAFFP
jgi:hypothetical protein